jgi:hypothetical protein
VDDEKGKSKEDSQENKDYSEKASRVVIITNPFLKGKVKYSQTLKLDISTDNW